MSSVRKNQLKWIKALRSGKFNQGRNLLHNTENNTYCCLGVANEVCKLGETSITTLESTYQQLGLISSNGSINGYCNNLTTLNDSGILSYQSINITGNFTEVPFTFDEIADILEIEYILGV